MHCSHYSIDFKCNDKLLTKKKINQKIYRLQKVKGFLQPPPKSVKKSMKKHQNYNGKQISNKPHQ